MAKRSGGGSSGRAAAAEQARQLLQAPVSFEQFRGKLSARDGTNVDRHLAAMDEEPDGAAHREMWTRLVRALATLAPHAASTTGQQAISFFIADGKYRMQVFALEDKRDGKLVIYAPDALNDAVAGGVLQPPEHPDLDPHHYRVGSRQTLSVEPLTAQNTPNPSPHYKHMLGWNRIAMRITLPLTAGDEQVAAAETLCAIAARQWYKGENAAPAAS